LDALIAPTAPVPAVIDSYGDAGFTGSSAQISALAGYPAINLPIGLVRELPVGMNIFGRAFSEPTLLQIAYGFEQILQARTPPTYIPTIGPDPTPESEASPADDDTPVDEDTPADGE
ncbi:MAG TPA: amidase family protein, partial [Thermomicrobiales bacterium]|nr:amidase family protein [Thermomicrobiales bacterium]